MNIIQVTWSPYVSFVTRLIKAGYLYLGSGRRRMGFLSRNRQWVVKVPLSDDGVADNAWEDRSYRLTDMPYARCRILDNHCLIMEAVDVEVNPRNLPRWAFSIDCLQVGYNRKGKLVAYDYGR